MEVKKYNTVDEYMKDLPQDVRKILESVRTAIIKANPKAEECISYGMPAYKYHGPLVYFAAFTHHIGFYATPSGHTAFKAELSKYKQGKGSVQFPIDEPMPLKLITQMVKFRSIENEDKAKLKIKK